jgi:signal peptidase I
MARRRKRRQQKDSGSSAPPQAEAAGAGEPPPADPGSAAPAVPRTFLDAVRENLEALIIAIILAIIIRHFAVEAYEIPTGSMANTLLGMHVELECPNCSTRYDVAISSDSETGKITAGFALLLVYSGRCTNSSCTLDLHSGNECQSCGSPVEARREDARWVQAIQKPARCPICHHVYRAVARASDIRGGDKILVTKFAFQLRKPERWDVIVFGFDQWKNYIKRLVGLPGERIDIFDGDIYVNGKIVAKSEHPYIQDELWTKISDSDVEERGLSHVPAWKEAAGEGTAVWTRLPGQRWSLNNLGRPRPGVLEYARRFDDYVSYNLFSAGVRGNAGVQVGDRKVAFTARPGAGKGWIGAEIRDGEFTFRLRIPVGEASASHPAVLERLSNEDPERPQAIAAPHPSGLRAETPAALKYNVSVRIELENVDDRVAARIDGKEILRLEYTSCPDLERPATPNGFLPQHLRLLGAGVQANIESIQVYRDIYYTPQSDPPPWSGITLGPGEYLALGDNSQSSSDGRYWGHIPETNLMGRALVVFWPALPWRWQCKVIR